MIPAPRQNTVGVLLVLYYISSWLETFLKVIDALLQVSDILVLTVSSKFTNFTVHLFLLIVKCLLALHLTLLRISYCEMFASFTSYIVQNTDSTVLWFGFCNHCILACFL
jgi:hypothetical protein